jgi:hypothetical protein
MSFASDLHAKYLELVEQYESKIEPLVDKWINIQIQKKLLDPAAKRERFLPEYVTKDGRLGFKMVEPDRHYCGTTTIDIPVQFFVDQQPWLDELEAYKRRVEEAAKSATKSQALQRVKTLKAELAKAEAELDKEEKGK